ncbi:MAG: 3-dehydroquinate synthase [Chloroflexia bacterium]|nr:3-dehydroquinate synthase [Chloroflexia bacterium]
MGGVERIVLVGFSGTGKTTTSRLLADALGWSAADCDDEIVSQWSTDVPSIFREHGEQAFRASERTILGELLQRTNTVIATGGGAVIDARSWDSDLLGRPGTLVIALDATPETILARLQRQTAEAGAAVERPMLASSEPLTRIHTLKCDRQSAYDNAHITVSVDGVSAAAAAGELVKIARLEMGQPLSVRLDTPSGVSNIVVARDGLRDIGERTRNEWPTTRRAWVVTDANVGPLHAPAVTRSLEDAGLSVDVFRVAAGESSKSLRVAEDLYDWLLGNGIERGDVVVALGGGMVGDLAGFVAATVLRGVGLVQVPTTLLATVDSSVGGKTGINHAVGKNLIGAFLQPPLVIADTAVLRTVPARELRSGWAEVIKHAVIQKSTPGGDRGDLMSLLERNAARLERLEEPVTSYLIWRNIALKTAVVAADEREAGIRAFLNFGHTLGHAIEAADYQLLHGEAVSLGIRAALDIGVSCGTCRAEDAHHVQRLLNEFDLPEAATFDEEQVLAKLGSDKKRVDGRQRFVLPLSGGGVIIRDDVSEDAVRQALATVNAPKAAA